MRRKKKNIQEDGVVEEVQRFHQQVLWKERKGQTRKGGKEGEGEEVKNWWSLEKLGKRFFLLLMIGQSLGGLGADESKNFQTRRE